jgi:hypothetical protein
MGGGLMNRRDKDLDAALRGIDQNRHRKLRRLILKGSFATPIVASFAMSGLTVEHTAAATNTTSSRPSDRRLKTDVTRIGQHAAGFGIYRFKYLWSDTEFVGVMAQEVVDIMPEAVTRGADGFLRVDYAAIGMRMERSTSKLH